MRDLRVRQDPRINVHQPLAQARPLAPCGLELGTQHAQMVKPLLVRPLAQPELRFDHAILALFLPERQFEGHLEHHHV